MIRRSHCKQYRLFLNIIRCQSTTSKYIPPSQKAILEHAKFSKERRQSSRIGKIIQTTFISIIGLSTLMYFWQPWNPYSNDVSGMLRKGLWEERDGNEDYLEALKYYQKALKLAKDEEMSQLTLQYTGIVLKIGEMYEKLGMKERELEVFWNLGEFLFDGIVNNDIDPDERGLLIDRDLIVTTRWAMLMEETNRKDWLSKVDKVINERLSYIENVEILKDMPWIVEIGVGKKLNIVEILDLWQESKDEWIDKYVNGDDGKDFLKCWNIIRSWKDKKWPDWIESFLRARDYYSMVELRKKNYEKSISLLQSNILWSVIGDFRNVIGLTEVLNLSSAWYELGIDREMKIKKIEKLNDKSWNDILIKQEVQMTNAWNKSEQIYLKLIEILTGISERRQSKRDKSNLAMSYYSLGILKFHLGYLQEADAFFDKAKELALENGLTQIIEKVDDETI